MSCDNFCPQPRPPIPLSQYPELSISFSTQLPARRFACANEEAMQFDQPFPCGKHGCRRRESLNRGRSLWQCLQLYKSWKDAKVSEIPHLFDAWHEPCLLFTMQGLSAANGKSYVTSPYLSQATRPKGRNGEGPFHHSLNDIMIHRADMITNNDVHFSSSANDKHGK